MDRCVPVVQSHRLDLDDVVLERFAVMRAEGETGGPWLVPLPFIGGAADWLGAFGEARRAGGAGPGPDRDVWFVELRLRAIRVEDPLSGGRQA